MTDFTDDEYNNIEGWCHPVKRNYIMNLIKETNAQVILEIGVYGGSSLIPMAIACKQKGSGTVHGIDPWDTEASKEGFSGDSVHYEWWGKLEHNKIYQMYRRDLNYFDADQCVVTHPVRSDDPRVIDTFSDESIDILHIDGNHSEKCATKDVKIWLPKLKPGGYLILDDISWPGTKVAQGLIEEQCEKLHDIQIHPTEENSRCADYGVYRKRDNK